MPACRLFPKHRTLPSHGRGPSSEREIFMRKAYRKGLCHHCGSPRCEWFQSYQACLRPKAEIDSWSKAPSGCKYLCGELGEMRLDEGKGPHAAQWTCPTCDRFQAWVPKWKLALILRMIPDSGLQ